MRSWVRYSVSAYLGLLLAGSIATPTPAIDATPNIRMRETRYPDTALPAAPAYRLPADRVREATSAQS